MKEISIPALRYVILIVKQVANLVGPLFDEPFTAGLSFNFVHVANFFDLCVCLSGSIELG